MEKSSKKVLIKGLVKGVMSGDHIIIHKSAKNGPAQEFQVFLASVQAPRMGNANRPEEPFGFTSREFLREKIVGKKCEFQVEYTYSARDYGVLTVGDLNCNQAIVKAGLAKVLEKKGNLPASKYHEDLQKAQAEATQKKIGIWNPDEKYIQKQIRNVTYFSESDYNPAGLFEQAKGCKEPMQSIVEYVFNASFITLYIFQFQTVAKMSLAHLFTPSSLDKELVAEGKLFTEKLILHRTVGVKFDKVEEGGNLSGRIFHPAGDISYEVLKNGFSKLNIPKNTDFDADYYKTLKEAQLIAQTKQVRIWKDHKMEESKQAKASVGDFSGKVVEVHSGDSLTVQRDSDEQLIRVFFTSLKAPAMMGKDTAEPEGYAWDGKEFLRKTAIAKKVNVVMEQSRVVQGKGGEERKMEFGTLFLQKNGKNLSCMVLEKGLAKTNVSKSGDNASRFLEDLLAAEKKALDQKLAMHSPAPAPMRIFNDLTQNQKKAKSFEAMIMKRPIKKFTGVVEYCFSGMRHKVRMDQEGTSISFSILGIKTMTNDKNQPQMLEYSNLALAFAKEHLFQRDISIELDFADKRGTFFGTLSLANKQDFAGMLLKEGLAQINIVGNRAPANIEQLYEIEEQAKYEGVGIWDKSLKLMTNLEEKQVKQNVRLQVEMTDLQDTSNFYVRILGESQYNKIDLELEDFDPDEAGDLEKPIKKGTLCAAKFSQDERWYRASIFRAIGKGEYEVQFIDFGNLEVVHGDDMKRLPQSLMQYEPQAKLCDLAYVRTQKANNDLGKEAAKKIQEVALEKISEVVVMGQFDNKLSVVMFEKGEKEWTNSVNAQLIYEGLAKINAYGEDEVPTEIQPWYKFQDEAKEAQIKIWQYGGVVGDSDDD